MDNRERFRKVAKYIVDKIILVIVAIVILVVGGGLYYSFVLKPAAEKAAEKPIEFDTAYHELKEQCRKELVEYYNGVIDAEIVDYYCDCYGFDSAKHVEGQIKGKVKLDKSLSVEVANKCKVQTDEYFAQKEEV